MAAVPSPFTVEVRPDQARVVVRPEGELDLATVEELRTQLDSLRTVGWKDLVLDLRGLSFLDSTGLRLLIDSRQQAEDDGSSFSIVDGEPPVSRLLELSGLSPLLRRADPAVTG